MHRAITNYNHHFKIINYEKDFIYYDSAPFRGCMFTSCNKDVENPDMQAQPEETAQVTRAYGDKTPLIEVYYEINDTNPLNALSYEMSGKKFIDLVQLFASNIQKDANGDPCIFFNDKLAPVMAAKATYIEPLQNAGIKVILNVLGDHKGIGISNLTDDQIEKFAAILTYIVKEYGLDGIGFDDEYADYSTPIDPTSASKLVLKLREKFNAEFPGERKIIQMFQWNYVSNIPQRQVRRSIWPTTERSDIMFSRLPAHLPA